MSGELCRNEYLSDIHLRMSRHCMRPPPQPVAHRTYRESALRGARSTDKLEALGEAVAIVDFARAETQRRAPHLTHPLLCLDAIRFGVEHGGRAGLRKVLVTGRVPRLAAAVDPLRPSSVCSAAIHTCQYLRIIRDSCAPQKPWRHAQHRAPEAQSQHLRFVTWCVCYAAGSQDVRPAAPHVHVALEDVMPLACVSCRTLS